MPAKMLAREFHGVGWTLEDYDALIERMDLGGRSAPGVLFHWAARVADGIKVVDVYESRQVADGLAASKIGPTVVKLGLTPPVVTEYPIYSALS